MKALHSAAEVVAAGLLPESRGPEAERVGARYAIALTPTMAGLIDPADPADPIGRQFLPDPVELETTPEERADPIGDLSHSPIEGIVHRYPDRVLLKPVHICPVYCRFCFRREMVGPEGLGTLTPEAIETALAYIEEHGEIWEVILTGGDPLMLSSRRTADLMRRLGKIAHVRVVRVHTRVPLVAPEMVDQALVAALKASGRPVWMAIHANHPREFIPAGCAALARLADAGISLVSQSVLLRGVNDDVETLAALMRAFVANRVKPYYLHHPDLAPGTSHFRLSIEEGQKLVKALRGRLSGLCQPTYVLDIPGGYGKAPLGEGSATALGNGRHAVEDFRGEIHLYPPED